MKVKAVFFIARVFEVIIISAGAVSLQLLARLVCACNRVDAVG